MSNSVLENLRAQWNQYNKPSASSIKPPVQGKPKPKHAPSIGASKSKPKLKSQFIYECDTCHVTVKYDTLWRDDIKNRYTALNIDTLLPHKCKHGNHSKTYKRNHRLKQAIFRTSFNATLHYNL